MALNGCSPVFKGVSMAYSARNFKSYRSDCRGIPHLPATVACSSIRSSWEPHLKLNAHSSKGIQHPRLSISSAPLLHETGGGTPFLTLPKLPKHRRRFIPPRVSKEAPLFSEYPKMTEKPKWWWRSLACLPYLIPLHAIWVYAENAFHLHALLEDFEFLAEPFLLAMGRLPSWFSMLYFCVAYFGVVRRKEWPHFFRFHVVMGMLLEIALQVVGTICPMMPLSIYLGKVCMHFWAAVMFAYLFTVVECMRCALTGMYADMPVVSDAAYVRITYG